MAPFNESLGGVVVTWHFHGENIEEKRESCEACVENRRWKWRIIKKRCGQRCDNIGFLFEPRRGGRIKSRFEGTLSLFAFSWIRWTLKGRYNGSFEGGVSKRSRSIEPGAPRSLYGIISNVRLHFGFFRTRFNLLKSQVGVELRKNVI